MKKIMMVAIAMVFVLGSADAFAGGVPACKSGSAAKGLSGKKGVHHSVQYRRRMRDLDKHYCQGSLTRTEYIQRKRQIKSMYK